MTKPRRRGPAEDGEAPLNPRAAILRGVAWGGAVALAFVLAKAWFDDLRGVHFFVAAVLGFACGWWAWAIARDKRITHWWFLPWP